MKQVLIIHDSLAGSTRDAAEIISAAIKARGHEVRVSPAKTARLEDCDALIVGSYIRYGKPAPAVRRFCRAHDRQLAAIPTAAFFSSLHLTTPAECADHGCFIDPGFDAEIKPLKSMNFSDRQHALSLYLHNLRPWLPAPLRTGYLRGRMDFSRMGLFDRLCMQAMSLFIAEVGEGDYFRPAAARELGETFADALGL